jgi:iron complex outermembrane receptor protein
MKMVSNPDRETKGGRVAATLDLSPRTSLETGIDFQTNEHTLRKASGAAVAGYDSSPAAPTCASSPGACSASSATSSTPPTA